MAMDKDALVKHKFWVMLAVAAPLALGAIFLLLTVVSSSIASLRKANEDAVKNIRPPADAKNEKNVDVKKDEAVKVTKTKDQAWEEAWLQQAHFFTWPKAFEEMGIDFQNGFFVTEAKVVKELPAKIEEKNKVAGVIERKDLEGNFFFLKGKKYPRTGSLIVTDERGNDKEKRRSLEDLAPGDLVVLTLQKSRYFDEPLTTVERDNYPKTSFYYSQLDAILAQVTPVNDKGKGIVWLGNLPYREGKWPRGARFFHYVPFPWDNDHDISSEAWIAQEDLWIQRELYYRVKVANDYLSKFDGKGKEGFNEPVTFTNPYWELTLTLQGSEDENKLLVKLKNRMPRRQKVNLSFSVKFHKNLVTGQQRPPRQRHLDHQHGQASQP